MVWHGHVWCVAIGVGVKQGYFRLFRFNSRLGYSGINPPIGHGSDTDDTEKYITILHAPVLNPSSNADGICQL